MTGSMLQVGVSFHSFAHEYLSFFWSFEDMMEAAAGLGRGIEIVGPSHHRGFPQVSDEFERTFKSAVERHGLTPVSYGSHADPFMLPDRNLTADEIFDYTLPQLEGAAKLGFPIVRLQHFASVCAERLVPVAERLGLWMGFELHVPMMVRSERTGELIGIIERIGSPALGLIPDAGIFARSISRAHLQMARDQGIDERIIAAAQDLWAGRTLIGPTLEAMEAMGADARTISWIGLIWDTFGFSDPSELADIIGHVRHFHGKFFSIEDGDEPDLRYEGIVHTLLRLGYDGWLMSEYEGNSTDSLATVRAHQAMVQRHVASYRP